MNRKKLSKLRRKLATLWKRQRNLTERELVNFAKKVGRRRDTTHGKEPTYVSDIPGRRPLSIPSHASRSNIAVGTAGSILGDLEADLDYWDEELGKGEKL